MKMIEARVADQKKVQAFLTKNEAIQADQLLEKGFVVEMDDQITGCYVIESVDTSTDWLKQLYLNHDEIFALPLLIETIIHQAKQRGVTKVFVHSHQQAVDQLLQSMQFHPQENPVHVHQGRIVGGTWWVYTIDP